MPRVVLDTDMGSDVDDALCLALALGSPEIDLAAVTCVGREARTRAQVARRLLELGGRPDVPVYAGCRVPVLAGNGFNWFSHEGEGILETGDEPKVESEHAVDALLRLFDAEDDLELVAIGPLTNLAVALMKEPDLAGRVRRLTVMGGHVRVAEYGGHVFAPGVDYNLCSDPEATRVALRAGMPTTLVTADATLRAWITEAELGRIEASASPLGAALARAVRIWTPVQKRLFGRAGCDVEDDNVAFLHDPLTLAVLYDESLCRFEDLEIEPAIEGRVLRTIERPHESEETRPMRCALDVDAARLREDFTERVLAAGAGPSAQAAQQGR
jgi:purine nucleosidase